MDSMGIKHILLVCDITATPIGQYWKTWAAVHGRIDLSTELVIEVCPWQPIGVILILHVDCKLLRLIQEKKIYADTKKILKKKNKHNARQNTRLHTYNLKTLDKIFMKNKLKRQNWFFFSLKHISLPTVLLKRGKDVGLEITIKLDLEVVLK